MAAAEPWQTAEIAGPKKAMVITKPEVVVSMIKTAKRPILIVGSESLNIKCSSEENFMDYVIHLAKIVNIPVVATAHIVGEFVKKGFKPSAWMPLVDIANRLQDSEWKGLDGNGQYDLAVFAGFPYYMEWVVLNNLKHFAPNLKTITLDRYYQPNASWSFPNLSVDNWSQNLQAIIEKLGGK
ncbi:MAG: CO dehydrogenase/acetyl-CoA synthase complex subunit epsilon [Candidatus Bathyarchaeia archaeon]